jgi:L-arabinokinase
MSGQEFLDRYRTTADTATKVDPRVRYPVQHAADHHVLEARRVKNFVEFLRDAQNATDAHKRKFLLDKAGHLMYASHLSYTNDAMLGAPECDLLVKLVRDAEADGLYGAKITGGGSGGTVAVLCDATPKADAALDRLRNDYSRLTGKPTDLFTGSSPGAWHLPTTLVPA